MVFRVLGFRALGFLMFLGSLVLLVFLGFHFLVF